jgi:hypothetical protein
LDRKNSFSNASADWGTFGACFTIKWIGTVHRPDPLKFRIGSCRSASCENLIEEGKVFDEAGQFRTNIKVDESDVPESVRLVVGRRLERLGDSEKRVLAPPRWSGANSAFSF